MVRNKSNEMLVALRDGYVDDDGELYEITAGKSHIALERYRENPAFADFFDPACTRPGSSSGVRTRVLLPEGGMIADNRY